MTEPQQIVVAFAVILIIISSCVLVSGVFIRLKSIEEKLDRIISSREKETDQ